MPTNDIKAFASAGGANVLTQAEYLALAALSTGFTSGKASAKEVNKAIRQATLVAAALAQFISDQGGVDVLDDGNVSGLAAKILAAVNKTSQPLDATLTALASLATGTNKLPYFTGTDTAAQTDLTQVGRDIISKANISDVLTYLNLSAFYSSPSSEPGNFSQVSSPDSKQYIFIANNGSWGAQSEKGATIALGIGSGGTGATTAAAARANLGLKGAATEDVVPVAKGGTGANNASDARKNINLGGFLSQLSSAPSDSNQMFSPDLKLSFVVANNGAWGLQKNSDGSIIALAVDRGGTGATTAAGSRANLGLGAVAVEEVVPVNKGGTAGTTAAQARNNLGLGNAATFTVGNGNGQIPNMDYFTKGAGWMKLPNGKILQWFQGTTSATAGVQIAFPMAFPTTANAVFGSCLDIANSGMVSTNLYNASACVVSAFDSTGSRVNTNVYIFAIGE